MSALEQRIEKVLGHSAPILLPAAGFRNKRLMWYRITDECEQMIFFNLGANWRQTGDAYLSCEVAIDLPAVREVIARGKHAPSAETLNPVSALIRRHVGDLSRPLHTWNCHIGPQTPILSSVEKLEQLCEIVVPWLDRYKSLKTAVRLIRRRDCKARIAAALVSRGPAAARAVYESTLPLIREELAKEFHEEWAASLGILTPKIKKRK
jgi:hypothetical protein